jgi:hypothetical protein
MVATAANHASANRELNLSHIYGDKFPPADVLRMQPCGPSGQLALRGGLEF